MRIVATTDVLLGDRRYDKGTVFTVAEAVAEGLVDADTAARWRQLGWADLAPMDAADEPTAPALQGALAQAPTALPDPLPQAEEGKTP